MSVFQPNSRYLRDAWIFCFHLKKTAVEARTIGRIIRSDSISHFETPKSHGNDSEARKLGYVRVEAEKRRICSMSTVGPMLQNR